MSRPSITTPPRRAGAPLLGHQHARARPAPPPLSTPPAPLPACGSPRSRLRRRGTLAAPPSCARRSMRVSPASAVSGSAASSGTPRRSAFSAIDAVHRARIDVDVAQQLRHAPRHRALPRAHRPVNRDDEFWQSLPRRAMLRQTKRYPSVAPLLQDDDARRIVRFA